MEEDLFARAMSGMADDDADADMEDSGPSRGPSKKRPRDTADVEYDSEGRVKERRRENGENGGGGGRVGSSSKSGGGVRTDLEKFRIPSPPR